MRFGWRKGAAAAACAASALVGCDAMSSLKVEQQRQELKRMRRQATELRQQLETAEQRARSLAAKAGGSASAMAKLTEALREMGVKVTPRGAAVVVTMASRVLFSPGQTSLRQEAREELVHVAKVLSERFADRPIAIEGHTDSTPPKRTAAEFPTNWDLSLARALAVLRCLVEEGGLAAERVHSVAYADTRPIADNGVPEGRAENRRVEIAVLPPIETATVSAAFE